MVSEVTRLGTFQKLCLPCKIPRRSSSVLNPVGSPGEKREKRIGSRSRQRHASWKRRNELTFGNQLERRRDRYADLHAATLKPEVSSRFSAREFLRCTRLDLGHQRARG